ncbi:hypothetical protein LCGC14_0672560 [marine sediment metagenome]|uniref:Uncharacterized protein n=1 Tax=marine sediment metagenome TaxID=412755 RepID=A0A0F9TC00_9ZZZZ
MPEISEQLEKEIDAAIDETTVVSEGAVEEVEVPAEVEIEKKQEDTQEEAQEDTQDGVETLESEDTPEDSDEDTLGKYSVEEDPAEQSISNQSIIRAMGNGLTFSEAQSFGTEESLNDFSYKLEIQKQQQRQYEFQAQQSAIHPDTKEPADPFANLPKLNPDDFDPEVVAKFDYMTNIAKNQHEQLQQLQANQEHIQTVNQETDRNEITQWFDSEFTGLGDDFKDVFGEGDYNGLNQGSVEFANRDKIASQMSVLISGYEAQGMQAPNRSDVFKMASQQMFPEKFTSVKDETLSKQLKQQSTQHIQRVNRTKASVKQTEEELDVELASEIDLILGK